MNITEKAKNNRIVMYVVFILAAIICACITCIYVTLVEYGIYGISMHQVCIRVFYEESFYLLAAIFFFIFVAMQSKGHTIFQAIYNYRFYIAIMVFILCIIFEINGSSIGIWNDYLDGTARNTIVGVSREIRSDEWAVFTPMTLSQYYGGEKAFPYFSEILRGCTTDMFMVYGQPVKDISVIFRPFQWGYLFLSASKGLAFFWCGRWIALFMTSFEFFMLVSKKEKMLALTGASLIAFAPVVQWWFAINGFVEMLIYCQLSILLLHKYILSDKFSVRVICIVVIGICAGGFILTLYPAWQIPMAYVIVGLAIWVLVTYHENIQIRFQDIICIGAGLIVFICLFAHIWSNSKETVELVMNTAYPGNRTVVGGGAWSGFFNAPTNIWYAIFGFGTGMNVCESAQFIDFFPFCYIFSIIILIKEKKKDLLSIILLCLSLFFTIWCVIGFGDVVSKITFMSYSRADRAFIILGFVNVILLIRSISIMSIRFNVIFSTIISVLFGWGIVKVGTIIFPEFYMVKYCSLLTILVFIVLYFMIQQVGTNMGRKVFCIMTVITMTFTGLLVNPIRTGIDSIKDIDVIKCVGDISKSDNAALWAIEGLHFPYNNLTIMAGAPTINSTNVYPNIERWESIDKGKCDEYVYNRYAHIVLELKESGNAEYSLLSSDSFKVTLTAKDLEKLGVTYILTEKSDLSMYENRGIDFDLIKQCGEFYIYRME